MILNDIDLSRMYYTYFSK